MQLVSHHFKLKLRAYYRILYSKIISYARDLLDKWRNIFGLTTERYKQYGHLKDKVLNQALNEINAKTGYHITMTEIKEGRKVARVKFDFEPDKMLTGLDKRIGKMTTRHGKPKKPQIATQEAIPEIHPDQQELAI